MSDDILEQGINALRDGDNRTARRLFGQVVTNEPSNVSAWWYLAVVIDDPVQKADCLRRVIKLHPDHPEATAMLKQVERQIAGVTPGKGFKRPVLDAEFSSEGVVTVPEPAQVNASSPQPPIIKTPDTISESRPDNSLTVAVTAIAVALIAIVSTVVLVWTGLASDTLGEPRPVTEPTVRSLYFDVPACLAVDGDGAVLVFINNTGVELELLEGPENRETFLYTIEPDEQYHVNTRPDVPVRYAVRSDDVSVAGSGAIFEVPAGSNCRVPIQ